MSELLDGMAQDLRAIKRLRCFVTSKKGLAHENVASAEDSRATVLIIRMDEE